MNEPASKAGLIAWLIGMIILLALSVIPASLAGAIGGVALESVTGLPYDCGFWIAAGLGYLVAVVYFLEYFYSTPEPRQQASGSGFLLGFLVGRFFK